LTIYVDDGLVIGEDKKEVNRFVKLLTEKFKITSFTPDTFIGMQIIRKDHELVLTQNNYIQKLIQSMGWRIVR